MTRAVRCLRLVVLAAPPFGISRRAAREALGCDERTVRRILADIGAAGWEVCAPQRHNIVVGAPTSPAEDDDPAIIAARRLAAERGANDRLRAELAAAHATIRDLRVRAA